MNFKIVILFMLLLICIRGNAQQGDTIGMNYKKSLFKYDGSVFKLKGEQLENKHRFLRFSMITGYRKGLISRKGLSSSVDEEHGTARVFINNSSIEELLSFDINCPIILEVKNPSKYRYDITLGSKLDWMFKNTYCFEYLFPYGTIKKMDVIKGELAHYFNVKFSVEKRLLDVLILFRTSNKDKIKSFEKGEGHYNGKGDFTNVNLDQIICFLENNGLPLILNETGYNDKVNLDIGDQKDIISLREKLKDYDLDIKLEERKMDVFVIRENNFKNENKL